MTERQKLLLVGLYAAAMAWVESAVVYYLRVTIDRVEPYQPNPLPLTTLDFGRVELVREAATLIMLLTVGWLAGRTNRARLGYALMAFGVWDILYYTFLIPMTGWPRSLFDWDILFLLPLPWWGPVLAPVSISLLMAACGALMSQFDIVAPRPTWLLNFVGVVVALYVFMTDAIGALSGGVEAVRAVLPGWFNWPLFVVALVLMSAPVAAMLRQLLTTSQLQSSEA
ncbi:MAG TPA: hypothetical protein VJL59_17340 [Anaerolineales bacterium]|nr:hypothetical protein [Anaerolineales bacterium]